MDHLKKTHNLRISGKHSLQDNIVVMKIITTRNINQ